MESGPAPEPAKPKPIAFAKLRLVSELDMLSPSDPESARRIHSPRSDLLRITASPVFPLSSPRYLFSQKFQVGIGSPAETTSSRYAPVWGGDGNSWLSTSSWIRYPMTLCQAPSASWTVVDEG